MKFFGFNLGGSKFRPSKENTNKLPQSETNDVINLDDITGVINVASSITHMLDIDQYLKTDRERISTYRAISKIADVDNAIDTIINEIVVVDDSENIVSISLDDTNFSDKIKTKISKEFNIVLDLIDLNHVGYDLIRNWYIDGRLVLNKIVEKDDLSKGILKLQQLDSASIKKVIRNKYENNKDGSKKITGTEEFYIYNPENKKIKSNYSFPTNVIQLDPDSIVVVNSGLFDTNKNSYVSYLEKAIKPANSLSMLEDSLVVYRLARAPERRVFYIDVGNLSKTKAEEYISGLISKYKNKIVYDSSTGTVKNNKNHVSMMEDLWLPRKEGCLDLSTNIACFGGDKTLSEMIDDHNNGIQNWTYSVSDNGRIVPGLVSWAGITRVNERVIKISLDNGESVTATFDHKFILRDGTKIDCSDLKVGDSLMPFYKSNEEIFDNKITKIEILEDKTTVGTLTIDKQHILHDYHNFSLSCGIFVMNSRGTEVSTLQSAQNLSEIADIEYFQKKLYKALMVPTSRLSADDARSPFANGSEITREELRFSKFIKKLQIQFSFVFNDILSTQLLLKNIINRGDWNTNSNKIKYRYNTDAFYSQQKENEILSSKLSILSDIDNFKGVYFSKNYIMKKILNFSQDEIEDLENEMQKENKENPPQEN